MIAFLQFAIVSKFAYSLLSVLAYMFLGMYFTKDMPIGESLFVLVSGVQSLYLIHTDPQYSIPSRLFLTLIYGYVFRLKYYFAWYMADSLSNLCGLGFSGYDERGQPKWDLVTIVAMRGVELPPNPRSVSISWNITSAKWLRR